MNQKICETRMIGLVLPNKNKQEIKCRHGCLSRRTKRVTRIMSAKIKIGLRIALLSKLRTQAQANLKYTDPTEHSDSEQN